MIQTNETRRAGDAAGLWNASLLGSIDDPRFSNSSLYVQDAIDDLRDEYAVYGLESAAKSGWRVTSAILLRAVDDLDRGDIAGAEYHRQIARLQFIDGNAAFRALPDVIEMTCASIRAEAAR
jgi:hypothetical protein